MDAASQLRSPAIGRVENGIVAEWNVSDRRVEEVLRECSVFERLAVNVGIRVELGGYARRNRIKFHAGASRAGIKPLRHKPEEMPHTH